MRHMLSALLGREGYEPVAAASGRAALDQLAASSFDAVLCDVRMPGMSGLELLAELGRRGIRCPVIVMSAYGSVELAIEAMKQGAYDYISKPFAPEEVVLVLRKAEERERLWRENQSLRKALAEAAWAEEVSATIVARAPAMLEILRTVAKLAEHKTTVLITGESGTGKELIARALHEHGQRRDQPFVAVNCGAIPEALLESELFGYRRGAFTDASRDKKGLCEEASSGTLFLDEVGELPLSLQVKLLRVLQDETIRRLGDTRDIKVDTRVVAATARDLHARVGEGSFREDLFYRLNVMPIHLPPLRERREEIPLLVERFIARNNRKLGLRIAGVAPEAMRLLYDYDWPGNVRELENTIERAMVLAEGERIDASVLPGRVSQASDRLRLQLASCDLSIKRTARVVEEELIRRALKRTQGNRTAAARLLEISHRALLYKIREYGIDNS
jgi:two-component system response regulator AtoC